MIYLYTRYDISVVDLSVDDLSVDDISVDDLSIDDISVDDKSVDDLSRSCRRKTKQRIDRRRHPSPIKITPAPGT